jgi:hypothetical protein
LTKAISDGIYWLVLILFLPAVLGVLAIEGLLAPVQGLMDRVLGFLPNILGAAIIVFVGWLVARLCQRVVAKLLAAIGLDRLGEGVGLDRVMGESRVSDLVGLVVYVLIIIPVVMSALDALSLAAITGPATLMLTQMLGVLPSLFAATLLLAVAYVVARVVSGVITRVLTAVGFDNVLAHVGFTVQGEATRGPSAVAGTVVVVAILLLGMLIFGVGLYLSRVAAEAIKASGAAQAALLSTAARGAIVVLSGTMALQQMQVASDIIAIAFGLGARESAGRAVETWIKALQER